MSRQMARFWCQYGWLGDGFRTLSPAISASFASIFAKNMLRFDAFWPMYTPHPLAECHSPSDPAALQCMLTRRQWAAPPTLLASMLALFALLPRLTSSVSGVSNWASHPILLRVFTMPAAISREYFHSSSLPSGLRFPTVFEPCPLSIRIFIFCRLMTMFPFLFPYPRLLAAPHAAASPRVISPVTTFPPQCSTQMRFTSASAKRMTSGDVPVSSTTSS